MLTDHTIPALLDAFSSNTPTPGGGSAAALAGAAGASLLVMVAGMPKTRTNTPEERSALDAAHAALTPIRDTLQSLIDRDAAAYDLVVAAFRQPKATDEEKAVRKTAIQDATRVATEVPLETIRVCVQAMRHGRATVDHGNPSASSDAKVAFRLLMAAALGARDNVDINLSGLTDDAVRTAIGSEAAALIDEATRLHEAVVG